MVELLGGVLLAEGLEEAVLVDGDGRHGGFGGDLFEAGALGDGVGFGGFGGVGFDEVGCLQRATPSPQPREPHLWRASQSDESAAPPLRSSDQRKYLRALR